MLRDILDFFRRAALNPLQTGAAVPSSRFLARAMLRAIPQGCADPVVEIGPGTGAITKHLVNRLKSPTLYKGIELNKEFADELRQRFPNLQIIEDSAENLLSHVLVHSKPKFIICSLPWTFLPKPMQYGILRAIKDSLQPGGTLSTFVFSHTTVVPKGGKHFQTALNEHFSEVSSNRRIWLNIPPADVFFCQKARELA